MKRQRHREAKGLAQGYKMKVTGFKRNFSVSTLVHRLWLVAVHPSEDPQAPAFSHLHPNQLTIFNMTTSCRIPEEECVFCDDKIILLQLQLRKINYGNTALGEATNKNVNQQQDVFRSDTFHRSEHEPPFSLHCHYAHCTPPQGCSSPQSLLLVKRQSIQHFFAFIILISRLCVFTVLNAAIKASDS